MSPSVVIVRYAILRSPRTARLDVGPRMRERRCFRLPTRSRIGLATNSFAAFSVWGFRCGASEINLVSIALIVQVEHGAAQPHAHCHHSRASITRDA